jgi:redox-sensitive bicupin YhaK (pirin superfamily)
MGPINPLPIAEMVIDGDHGGPRRQAMMTLRKAADRGHADHGWLDSRHTFSFADYYDPAHMGFRGLRVINDDRVEGGQGFGAHPHRDMEILSYVLDGALAHKDSTGTRAVIRAGDVQRMSAGTGVVHSEFNASADDEVHFLQIWLMPKQRNLAPGYEQKQFTDADKRGRLALVASPTGKEGSLTIHADVQVYAGILGEGDRASVALAAGRGAWVQVARGKVRVNGQDLAEGDGLALEDVAEIAVDGRDDGEVLVFDMA